MPMTLGPVSGNANQSSTPKPAGSSGMSLSLQFNSYGGLEKAAQRDAQVAKQEQIARLEAQSQQFKAEAEKAMPKWLSGVYNVAGGVANAINKSVASLGRAGAVVASEGLQAVTWGDRFDSQIEKAENWLIDKWNVFQQKTTADDLDTSGKVVEGITTGMLYSINPAGALALAGSSGRDIVTDDHLTGKQKAGAFLEIGANLISGGVLKGVAAAGKGYPAFQGILKASGMKYGAEAIDDIVTTVRVGSGAARFTPAVDDIAKVTIRTGIKNLPSAVTEGATVTGKAFSWQAVRTVSAHLAVDASYGAIFQASSDLKEDRDPTLRSVAEGAAYGAAGGAVLRGATSIISRRFDAKAGQKALSSLEEVNDSMSVSERAAVAARNKEIVSTFSENRPNSVLGEFYRDQDDLMKSAYLPVRQKKMLEQLQDIEQTAQSKIDLGVLNKKLTAARKDGVKAGGTIEELIGNRGFKVEWVDGPMGGKGGSIDRANKVIRVSSKSPDSLFHEVGHVIEDYDKKLVDLVYGEIRDDAGKVLGFDINATKSDNFANAVRAYYVNPRYVSDNFPKLTRTIESVMGILQPMSADDLMAKASADAKEAFMNRATQVTRAQLEKIQKYESPEEAQAVAEQVTREFLGPDATLDDIKQYLRSTGVTQKEIKATQSRFSGTRQGADASLSPRITGDQPAPAPTGRKARFAPEPAADSQSPFSAPVDRTAGMAGEGNYRSGFSNDPQTEELIGSISKESSFDGMLQKMRGGRLTEEQLRSTSQRLIDDGKITKEMVLKIKPGTAATAEAQMVVKQFTANEAKNYVNLLDTLETAVGAEKDVISAKLSKSRQELMEMAAISRGLLTESARALQSSKARVFPVEFDNKDIEAIRKAIGEEAAADVIGGKVAESISSKTWSGYLDYWYAASINGPFSWLRTVVANVPTQFVETFSKMVGHSIVDKESFGAMAADYLAGAKEGFRLAQDDLSKIGRFERESGVKGFAKGTANFLKSLGHTWEAIDHATLSAAGSVERGLAARRLTRQGIEISPEDMRTYLDEAFEGEIARLSLRTDPDGFAGDVVKGLSKMRNSENVASRFVAWQIMPFARTSVNALNMSTEYVPVAGMVRSLMKYSKGKDKAQLATEMAKQVIGLSIFATGFESIRRSAEPIIYGRGPSDPAQRKTWLASGAQPYSIKIGDKYVPFLATGALTGVLSVLGSYSDAKHFGKSEGLADVITTSVQGFARSQLDQAYMQGLNRIMTAFETPENASDYLAGLVGGLVPLPAIVKQPLQAADSLTGDLTVKDRNSQSFWQKVGSASGFDQIPGIGEKIFGKSEDLLDIYGNSIQKNLIYGLSWTSDDSDPVTDELLRLKQSVTTSDVISGQELSDDQKVVFLHEFGTRLHDALTLQMATEEYQGLSDEAKKKYISRIRSAVRDVTADKMVEVYPDLGTKIEGQTQTSDSVSEELDTVPDAATLRESLR